MDKEKMISGIYKITNTITSRIYVGGSKNIISRFRCHKSYITGGNPCNKLMVKDYELYGIDKFVLEIIEECATDKIEERETYYHNLYKLKYPELMYNKRSVASTIRHTDKFYLTQV